MSMTDPIADLLLRIRNAQAQKRPTVSMPASKLKSAILNVLHQEGYILGVTEAEDEQGHKNLTVTLKYHQGQPVITWLKRVSTPGKRVYSQATELPMVSNGLGTTIVSTSRGVITDSKARELNVGGEVLCQVM